MGLSPGLAQNWSWPVHILGIGLENLKMTQTDAQENAPIRKIVPKGKKENAPIFQNNKK